MVVVFNFNKNPLCKWVFIAGYLDSPGADYPGLVYVTNLAIFNVCWPNKLFIIHALSYLIYIML